MSLTPQLPITLTGMQTNQKDYTQRDFGKLKSRAFTLPQVQADIFGTLKSELGGSSYARKTHEQLFKIIENNDITDKRNFSKYYYNRSGMYSRAVRYISDIYKFDFVIYPNLDLDDELPEEKQKKILQKFNNVLEHFDNSAIQLMSRKWAINVCLHGCYYGYICDDVNDKLVIQDLPVDYCRSRFTYRGLPLVEFNVQYFDKVAKEESFRKKLLELFPEEIRKAYRKYKNGGLQPEDQGDSAGWVLLDVDRAFKFNFSDSDIPPFLSAIPSLLELEEVQDLEKEKLLQEIQKILIQTFDLDKNGQIPFTTTELQQLNQNAVDMVGDAVGVSVLSTIADVHMEDLSTNTPTDSQNRAAAAEDTAYNQFGISTNLFNTDGNLALDKSITIDEAFAKPLLLQFEQFFNRYLEWKFNKKDFKFRFKMLTTTIFNYKDFSNSYKDLTKLGFSRFYPIVALGHTQKEVISLAKLEQQILQLDAYMLPPFSSNTMSSDTWSDIKTLQEQIIKGGKGSVGQIVPGEDGKVDSKTGSNDAAKTASSVGEDSKGGRPALPDDQKSDKTIANMASQ